MKSFFALALTLLTILSFHAKADDADLFVTDGWAEIPGATIIDSDDKILVILRGNQIQSNSQLQDVLSQSLKVSDSYVKDSKALYKTLTSKKIIAKQIDITIMQGEDLKSHIGANEVQSLLDILNDAQAADPGHMSTMYWQ